MMDSDQQDNNLAELQMPFQISAHISEKLHNAAVLQLKTYVSKLSNFYKQ